MSFNVPLKNLRQPLSLERLVHPVLRLLSKHLLCLLTPLLRRLVIWKYLRLLGTRHHLSHGIVTQTIREYWRHTAPAPRRAKVALAMMKPTIRTPNTLR